MEQCERATLGVVAGIPACRRAGLPARRKKPHAKPDASKSSLAIQHSARSFRAAGMPDATASLV